MKVAVWAGDNKPDSGGAFSLLETIKKNISNGDHSFHILYKDTSTYSDKTVYQGLEWLNIKPKKTLKEKIQGKFKKEIKKSLFDAIAEKENIDIFWIAFPDVFEISYPYIYTVWDLGHREVPFFPEVSRTGWSWDAREETYRKMLYKASYILTGNEEGKNELLRNYSLRASKIIINPFPVADFCLHVSAEKPAFDIKQPFIFYPAQFWPHKNHIRILQALHILKKQGISITLVLTGSDKGNKEYIQKTACELSLESSVLFTGFLKEAELVYLYKNALAMVFASLMGPNNMPPIEATALGCPVIITNLQGHQEQLQDTALYFDGLDATDLAKKIALLYNDTRLRDSLIQKQSTLAASFLHHNYCEVINTILREFEQYRLCWGKTYTHT